MYVCKESEGRETEREAKRERNRVSDREKRERVTVHTVIERVARVLRVHSQYTHSLSFSLSLSLFSDLAAV